MPNNTSKPRVALAICLFLTVAAFWSVIRASFLDFDDSLYITQNAVVRAGLTDRGFLWAFHTGFTGNWHPVTWLSHMLDCQLFGMDASWHHFVNLLLHVLNSILLFAVMERMTKAPWKSVFVAALFALHPLHVESVAWISERKDLLSTCFGLLAVLAYIRYAGRGNPKSKFKNYLLTILFFALALLSKPMLVTLPFLLLLFDFWPLGRFGNWRSQDTTPATEAAEALSPGQIIHTREPLIFLVWEKLPLFALAVGSSIVTLNVQNQAGAVVLMDSLPLSLRITNALVSYCRYILKMFWPVDLAAFYPYPDVWPAWIVVGAGAFLVCVTVLAIRLRNRRPYLAVGWFWYLGTLVPVIGLVQVGLQSMADRYTYLPLAGLFIMVAWGLSDLVSGWRHARMVLGTAAAVGVAACAVLTAIQAQYWKNSLVLFEHALAVTQNNALAQFLIGIAFAKQGKIEEAIPHFTEAIQIKPDFGKALQDLGLLLVMQGKLDDGIARFRTALKLPAMNTAELHEYLASALAQKGEFDEAIGEFKTALVLDPGYSRARINLSRVLLRQGRLDEARAQWTTVLQREPNNADAHFGMGLTFAAEKNFSAALGYFKEAARLRPGDGEVQFQLGNALAEAGKPEEAQQHYALAFASRTDRPAILSQHAQALVANGSLAGGVLAYRTALRYDPQLPAAHLGLAVVLNSQGKLMEATEHLTTVLERTTNHWEAHRLMGLVLEKQGQSEEALRHFSEAARINPTNSVIRSELAMVLDRMGRTGEAVEQYQAALRLEPKAVAVLNNLAWILAANPAPEIRDGKEAVRLAEQACQLTGFQAPMMVGTLGAAYAEDGRFEEAVAMAKKAEALAAAAGKAELAQRNKKMAELFLSRQAFHESAPPESANPQPKNAR